MTHTYSYYSHNCEFILIFIRIRSDISLCSRQIFFNINIRLEANWLDRCERDLTCTWITAFLDITRNAFWNVENVNGFIVKFLSIQKKPVTVTRPYFSATNPSFQRRLKTAMLHTIERIIAFIVESSYIDVSIWWMSLNPYT